MKITENTEDTSQTETAPTAPILRSQRQPSKPWLLHSSSKISKRSLPYQPYTSTSSLDSNSNTPSNYVDSGNTLLLLLKSLNQNFADSGKFDLRLYPKRSSVSESYSLYSGPTDLFLISV